jgi:N-acetylmuramic acid 6-phosphate etherase
MSTENRNPRSTHLDEMSSVEIVRLMNQEDLLVVNAVKQAEESISVAMLKVSETYKNGGRVIYVGSGTSGRIAAMDAAEMLPTFGIDPGRFVAIVAGEKEGRLLEELEISAEDDHHSAIVDLNNLAITRKDIVIGLAASGRTPFVLSAIRHSKQKGVWTCGISNSRNTPLLAESDHSILVETGPEVLTGSTRLKAGTAQKMVLNCISTGAMVLCGKVVENLMVDVVPKNSKLKERCVRIIRELTTVTEDEAKVLLEKNDWDVRAVLDNLNAYTV